MILQSDKHSKVLRVIKIILWLMLTAIVTVLIYVYAGKFMNRNPKTAGPLIPKGSVCTPVPNSTATVSK